jgi:hypothetical protein
MSAIQVSIGAEEREPQKQSCHKRAQKVQMIFPVTSFVLFVPFCGKIGSDDGSTVP